MKKIMFLGVFLPTVITFFGLKCKMKCACNVMVLYSVCFFHQQVHFFVFLFKFISEFILFPQDCHKSTPKSTINEKSS